RLRRGTSRTLRMLRLPAPRGAPPGPGRPLARPAVLRAHSQHQARLRRAQSAPVPGWLEFQRSVAWARCAWGSGTVCLLTPKPIPDPNRYWALVVARGAAAGDAVSTT